ncbi:MAG TPA: amino acid ABC transporter permease [Candidatus Wunengus sp. YC63]|uniref:amino acid ABC transporter permease n=1 Tax=Candidatus Wunengus sp. YC63 TaxID=3367699 RepID=UPI004026EB47
MYDWDFGIILRYKWIFVQGAWITLEITFFAVIFGTVAGVILGIGRSAKSPWIRLPVGMYVEFFLAMPILVLLIWIYYCGPIFLNVSLSGFWTAILSLGLTLSAFVAEIVRSGILAVPSGQVEAARVLGMNKIQAFTWITMPQAIRVMIPPLLSMYIATLKTSSLASVIAVYELLHSAQSLIMNTFRPLEIYTTVALCYVAMVLPLSLLTRRFESSRKWKII